MKCTCHAVQTNWNKTDGKTILTMNDGDVIFSVICDKFLHDIILAK